MTGDLSDSYHLTLRGIRLSPIRNCYRSFHAAKMCHLCRTSFRASCLSIACYLITPHVCNQTIYWSKWGWDTHKRKTCLWIINIACMCFSTPFLCKMLTYVLSVISASQNGAAWTNTLLKRLFDLLSNHSHLFHSWLKLPVLFSNCYCCVLKTGFAVSMGTKPYTAQSKGEYIQTKHMSFWGIKLFFFLDYVIYNNT